MNNERIFKRFIHASNIYDYKTVEIVESLVAIWTKNLTVFQYQ